MSGLEFEDYHLNADYAYSGSADDLSRGWETGESYAKDAPKGPGESLTTEAIAETAGSSVEELEALGMDMHVSVHTDAITGERTAMLSFSGVNGLEDFGAAAKIAANQEFNQNSGDTIPNYCPSRLVPIHFAPWLDWRV